MVLVVDMSRKGIRILLLEENIKIGNKAEPTYT